MQVLYDGKTKPTPSTIYLATSNGKKLHPLNSIDLSSVEYTEKCNDLSSISFDLHAFTTTQDGKRIRGAGYDIISKHMRLYVSNIGWFICHSPIVHNTGSNEYKSIEASSAQVEFSQIPLRNWKVNRGTTDSLEMLVDDNVTKINDVEFAKENIKFYNPENPSLSLVHILVSKLDGWSIGTIDDTPKLVDGKSVLLADEVGTFDILDSNCYAFMTQDLEKYFQIIVEFDFLNYKVNFLRVENYGKETDITIGFRNVERSNEISVDDDNIFTRFFVSGGNNLGIEQVNGGSNELIYLDDYWLNERYLSSTTIEKYREWEKYCTTARQTYADQSSQWNELQEQISELKTRMPEINCDPANWKNLEDSELASLKADYEAQKLGYEKIYVDENGEFDISLLNSSPDANRYHQIVDTILPNIAIEVSNRKLPSSIDTSDYLEEYETKWEYYGLLELGNKLQSYRDIQSLLRKEHYDISYDEYTQLSQHDSETYPLVTLDGFTSKHAEYEKALAQLNESNPLSCAAAYNSRKAEIDLLTRRQKAIDTERSKIATNMSLKTWNGENGFSSEELAEIQHLLNPTTYTNENIFIVSTDNLQDVVKTQMKLYESAWNDILRYAIPQYTYTTTLDNILANSTGKKDLLFKTGDFIRLETTDGHFVKLRMISATLNPCLFDNNLSLTFSNMIKSRRGTDDFVSLLNLAGNIGNGSISSFANGNGVTNDNIYDLLKKILQSSSFNNKVEQIVNTSKNLSLNYLKAKDVYADNAFFEYMQAQLIAANKVVAESADFKTLNTLVGRIDSLLSGTVSTELGHIIKLTAENVHMDEAVIRDLIAANITVSMLQAGNISSNSFNILSDDGGMELVGNTMRFKDADGRVRIQIGRDASNNFTFVLYDETGNGVLIDSTGIKKSAISDGLIVNQMIADGTIQKSKLGFRTVETDENGKVSITEILDPNGNSLGESYTEMQRTVEQLETSVSQNPNYTVILGNEFQNIPCKGGMSKSEIIVEIPFTAYKGTNRISSTATVGVLPSGMTLLENTAATSEVSGLIRLLIPNNSVVGGSDVYTGKISMQFTLGDQTVDKYFTWTKTEDGESVYSANYIIHADNDVVKRNDEVIEPSTLTFSALKIQNASTTNYSGFFKIVEYDGDHVATTRYQSVQGEESVTYAISSSAVSKIECSLYSDSSLLNLLDVKSVYVLADTDVIVSKMTEITSKMTVVSSTLDKQAKEIADKVTSSQVSTLINDYDSTTVKTLRDTVSEHTTSLSGITQEVSDVKSTLAQKADGSTVQSLSEQTSRLEQEASGFRQTVSETYATKGELQDQSTQFQSQVTQTANQFTQTVTDYKTDVESRLTQTANEFRLQVSRKQDVLPSNIRFVRDWLNTNNIDTEKRWENISIIVNDTNIASGGRDLAQLETTEFTSDISEITDFSAYHDDAANTYVSSLIPGWHYIQTDVGSDFAFDSGKIVVQHDSTGEREYDTKIEVSADGENWFVIFDSTIGGKYAETPFGKTYFISNDMLDKTIGFIKADMDNILTRVEQNNTNYAEISTSLNGIMSRVESSEIGLQGVQNELIPSIQNDLINRIGEVSVKAEGITNTVSEIQGMVERQSTEILDANGWKVALANIGGYDSQFATEAAVALSLTSGGVTINRSDAGGYKTVMTGDTISIQYDNGRGEITDSMRIDRDIMNLSRIRVSNGVDHGTIKEIPISYTVDNSAIGCLAFVSGRNNV